MVLTVRVALTLATTLNVVPPVAACQGLGYVSKYTSGRSLSPAWFAFSREPFEPARSEVLKWSACRVTLPGPALI